jgi:hypothetical protein
VRLVAVTTEADERLKTPVSPGFFYAGIALYRCITTTNRKA